VLDGGGLLSNGYRDGDLFRGDDLADADFLNENQPLLDDHDLLYDRNDRGVAFNRRKFPSNMFTQEIDYQA
jgi:hypothetical protein